MASQCISGWDASERMDELVQGGILGCVGRVDVRASVDQGTDKHRDVERGDVFWKGTAGMEGSFATGVCGMG